MSATPQFIKNFIAAAITGAALIGPLGCAGQPASDFPIEDWSMVASAKEPRAEAVQYDHVVRFSNGEYRLSEAELRHIRSFLAGHRVGRGDEVYVIGGETTPAPGLAGKRREKVISVLRRNRVKARVLPEGIYPSSPESGTLRIVVRRYVVNLPGCPDWTGIPGRTFNNQVSSNFGCATAINLGMSVAAPKDLLVGRDPGPADGEFAARAINRYRRDEIKPLNPEDIGVIESQQK